MAFDQDEWSEVIRDRKEKSGKHVESSYVRLHSAACLGPSLPVRSYEIELGRHSFKGSRRLRVGGTVDIRGTGAYR
jgi:hypothetical protein